MPTTHEESVQPVAFAVPIGGGWSIICKPCAEAHDADPALVSGEGRITDFAKPLLALASGERCEVCA